MIKDIIQEISNEVRDLKKQGLYKSERIMSTPQSALISTKSNVDVLNLCANNYLGFSSNKTIIKNAINALEKWGYGLSSVRFICGTQAIHKELENKLSAFLRFENAIIYSSAFDANGGLFEPLLNENDAIISDELNHASIIDGIRLCKAKRYRYKNNNMEDLETKLQQALGARRILIATDGVFSMDGIIANLKGICDLADKYNALVMVDDSHATGVIGKSGRGSIEYCGVIGRVDILTGTFGKSLGGASGGFTVANNEIIELLRQKSRPYLFSNSLAPMIASTSISVLKILDKQSTLIKKLEENTMYFRTKLMALKFDIIPSTHPIVPIMLYDAQLAAEFAEKLLGHGIYVISFSFPVVPKEKARIRVQLSSAHSMEQLNKALKAFEIVGRELKVIL
jgi:glycine C-acetyltransferase|tara:strand:- start:3599 stop:4789 length:1191 start_codon:yes stop_codon:yes gene_type:complete